MPGIFRESFDIYNGTGVAPGIQSRWASTGSFQSLVAGLLGTGQALQGAGGSSSTMTATFDSAASSLTVTGTIKIIVADSAGATRNLLAVRSGATWMCGINFLDNGVISAMRQTSSSAGTVLGSSANNAYTVGQVHSFALEIVIHDTTGRMTLYIDDATTPVLNLTNVDTKNSTPTTVDTLAISLWDATGGRGAIDDLYVTDSATKPANWPLRVETIYPNADGATLNFTPSTGTDHFAVVDEAQASTTDYLSGSSVGDVDELALGNLSSTPTGIEEIGVVGHVHRTDATARSIALGVKSGATTSDGSNIALAASVGRLSRTLATDPNTSAAWTASGVNALQLRPKVTV